MSTTTVTDYATEHEQEQHHGAQHASALALPLVRESTLRRSVSNHDLDSDARLPDDLIPLARSASAISGHGEGSDVQYQSTRTSIARPGPIKLGPAVAIHEVPSEFSTPTVEQPLRLVSATSTRPLIPPSEPLAPRETLDVEDHTAMGYPDVGTIASWRGVMILSATCGAQLLDNVFMTGVNISLPAIQKDFPVDNSQLQWLISAYTLTFGGFLLLAGVMSDRYGRKKIFCIGMFWLSIWTLAIGFATSFIEIAIFRALQGIGAAMTVPSGIGIISSFFVSRDRAKALSYFGASGAVGFCLGLILGGFITSSLGWRYFFYLTAVVTTLIGGLGIVTLPKDRAEFSQVRPQLDFLGASLSTAGLILLSFVLSSGGDYGWSKAFIIALLLLSILLLAVFTYIEKKVPNPIMPLSLWKVPNFAAIWLAGFVMYGSYQTLVFYLTLLSQDVLGLSAGSTALRLLPMGAVGGAIATSMGRLVELIDTKFLLLTGLLLCTVAPLPCALIPLPAAAGQSTPSFWRTLFPTSLLGVAGVAVGYCTITVVLLASVPVGAKSLCGGMVNTAFQLGSGVGLALATAVVQATTTTATSSAKAGAGAGALEQYRVGMWCCAGLAGTGLVCAAVGVRRVGIGGERS